MKLAAIIGSPRGMKGNTGTLLNAVLDAARGEARSLSSTAPEVALFSLVETRIGPCTDCAACHKTGACPIPDDFEKTVKPAMLAADGIVLASPNYIGSVTAQMKCLFDRCCGLLHTQMLEGRYGAAVVTSGGPESAEVEEYTLRFLRTLGCWTVGSVGAEARQLFDPDARARRLDAAADLGKKLAQAIYKKQAFPEQLGERRPFAERMKALVTARKADWLFEYEHWKSRGRL